jgi:Cysteine-rich CPXCG
MTPPSTGPDSGADPDPDDGLADVAATVQCPHCGATVTLTLDPGGGGLQDYVEDCAVCCRPWRVTVRYAADGAAAVVVAPLDE